VGFSASGLSVTKACGREAVDGHVDQPLDARVIKYVGLTRFRLEDDVERERLHLVAFAFVDLRK
jgi:hypothetical protein